MAANYGFPIEEHFTTTPDGYILRLFRIPYGRHEEAPTEPRPPLLFVHGSTACSDVWIIHGPQLSPAYYYANRGYDVWMLNLRGNYYSRNHTTLDPDTDVEFWDFNIVTYTIDFRACLDYVLAQTGYQSIAVMGNSLGATTMMFAVAIDPDYYREHISIMVPQAALLLITHETSLTMLFEVNNPWVFNIIHNLGIVEVTELTDLQSVLDGLLCRLFENVCMLMSRFALSSNKITEDPVSFAEIELRMPSG